MAEREGFEPPEPYGSTVFKTYGGLVYACFRLFEFAYFCFGSVIYVYCIVSGGCRKFVQVAYNLHTRSFHDAETDKAGRGWISFSSW